MILPIINHAGGRVMDFTCYTSLKAQSQPIYQTTSVEKIIKSSAIFLYSSNVER